ncbi:hypothetical protein [Arthrobacter sp. KNU40]
MTQQVALGHRTVGDRFADRPAVAGARVRGRIGDGENPVADLELGDEIDR